MRKMLDRSLPCFSASVALFVILAATAGAQSGPYFPPAGSWEKKAPAELGLDPA